MVEIPGNAMGIYLSSVVRSKVRVVYQGPLITTVYMGRALWFSGVEQGLPIILDPTPRSALGTLSGRCPALVCTQNTKLGATLFALLLFSQIFCSTLI